MSDSQSYGGETGNAIILILSITKSETRKNKNSGRTKGREAVEGTGGRKQRMEREHLLTVTKFPRDMTTYFQSPT